LLTAPVAPRPALPLLAAPVAPRPALPLLTAPVAPRPALPLLTAPVAPRPALPPFCGVFAGRCCCCCWGGGCCGCDCCFCGGGGGGGLDFLSLDCACKSSGQTKSRVRESKTLAERLNAWLGFIMSPQRPEDILRGFHHRNGCDEETPSAASQCSVFWACP